MVDLRISEFADGGSVQESDEIATNRGGINTKVNVGSIAGRDAEEFLEISDIPDMVVTRIIAGDNVTVSGDTGEVTVSAAAGGGGGEVNTASNVGSSGEGVFKQKSGVDLQFKKIVAGANITVTGGTDTITLTGPAGGGSGDIDTASNIGDDSLGGGVFNSISGSDLRFNRIIAGSNVTITGGNSGGNITIAAAGASGGALLASNNLSDLVNVSTARTNLGLGTLALMAAAAVAITGGNIDGTAIGATTRAAGAFTTIKANNLVSITQPSATEFVDGTSIPYNFILDNPGLTVSTYDTSNDASSVHYGILAVTNKVSGVTDAAAMGAEIYTSGSNVGIWGATINATIQSGHTGCDAHGLEIAVRDFGGSGNNGYALVLVGMGNNLLESAIQIQSNTGGGGTSAQFTYGLNFNSSPKNPITSALIRSDSGCTSTYGAWLTGAHTIGFEHAGSGATAGFRCTGGGTAAYGVASSGYTYGLDFRGINFSGGYILAHNNIEIFNTGVVNYKYSLAGSAGALMGYLPCAINSTPGRIPVHAV